MFSSVRPTDTPLIRAVVLRPRTIHCNAEAQPVSTRRRYRTRRQKHHRGQIARLNERGQTWSQENGVKKIKTSSQQRGISLDSLFG